jgi:hypothetical protein
MIGLARPCYCYCPRNKIAETRKSLVIASWSGQKSRATEWIILLVSHDNKIISFFLREDHLKYLHDGNKYSIYMDECLYMYKYLYLYYIFKKYSKVDTAHTVRAAGARFARTTRPIRTQPHRPGQQRTVRCLRHLTRPNQIPRSPNPKPPSGPPPLRIARPSQTRQPANRAARPSACPPCLLCWVLPSRAHRFPRRVTSNPRTRAPPPPRRRPRLGKTEIETSGGRSPPLYPTHASSPAPAKLLLRLGASLPALSVRRGKRGRRRRDSRAASMCRLRGQVR